ncbi:MAG: hypothetical protein ACREIT_12320 [Tepidisphaeraceae bacterium]
MGIREKLNQNPAITTGATALVVVIALGFIIYQLVGGGPDIPTESYYSIDDGKTWFEDDINLIPPFDKDGQKAYRAQVFTCDGGKTKFVAYLERYTPEAKKQLEDLRAGNQPPEPGINDMVMMNGLEYKKPGDPEKEWTRQTDFQKMSQIMEPKCPDGTTNNLEPVHP